jgi:hypothetical protein
MKLDQRSGGVWGMRWYHWIIVIAVTLIGPHVRNAIYRYLHKN